MRDAGHDFRQQCLVGGTRREVGADRLRNLILVLQQQRFERLQMLFAFLQCRHRILREGLLLPGEYPVEPRKFFAGLSGLFGFLSL